jgi:hypothetical protein
MASSLLAIASTLLAIASCYRFLFLARLNFDDSEQTDGN